MTTALAILLLLAFLLAGIAFGALLDAAVEARLAGRRIGPALTLPWRRAAAALALQQTTTEAPDRMNWLLAPVIYLALAALGMSVVPFSDDLVVVDFDVGIVVWGACESLLVVAVFLHGWSPNSPLPLIGAYRYVAIGLPVMLVSMFVLIAVALPAQSLSVVEVVRSQSETWNAVRHPLGLPLFLILGLSLTLRGPFDYADAADLAGGTSAEDSGAPRVLWQVARLAMLVSFAAMASAAFLGGPLGPWLPGAVWLALKMALVMTLVVLAGALLARLAPGRMLPILWTVFLPLAFVDLGIAGVLALW